METIDHEVQNERFKKLENFLKKMSSPIERKDRNIMKLKYYDKAPHPSIHNHHTIKWLRQRVNGNTIEKSVKSLLPNNGECLIEEDKSSQKYKLKQFLKEYYKKEDKFKNINITPKYFFSELIMNKIKKLRDIFLEFDEDGSRKLEIDEMVIMFKTNNIKVVQDDLKTLFFKDDKKLQDDELYLDFYQFMEFALNKVCDQDFRLFMRKLKNKRHNIDRKSILSEELRSRAESFFNLNNENNQSMTNTKIEDEEALFLPMNFNLLLDYFNNKGKQRGSMSKIQEAIHIMTKIIDGGIDNLHNKEKDNHTEDKNNESFLDGNDENFQENEQKKLKQVEENFKLHDTLDCRILLEEFRKLFAQKPTADYEDNATAIIEKLFKSSGNTSNKGDNEKIKEYERKNLFSNLNENKKKQISSIFKMNRDSSTDKGRNIQINKLQYQGSNNSQISNSKENKILSADDLKPEDMVFTNYIKNKLETKDPNEISIKQYNKYKSLLLAFEETKKCLNNPESSVASIANTKSTNFSFNKKSIGYIQNKKINNIYPINDGICHTTKEWNKNSLFSKDRKNNENNIKTINSIRNDKFSTNNSIAKKLNIPDPQYNFNYKTKYFGIDEINKECNRQQFNNFLLPTLKSKDSQIHNNDHIPINLLNEFKKNK